MREMTMEWAQGDPSKSWDGGALGAEWGGVPWRSGVQRAGVLEPLGSRGCLCVDSLALLALLSTSGQTVNMH